MSKKPEITLRRVERPHGAGEGMYAAYFDVATLGGTLTADIKVYAEHEHEVHAKARHFFKRLLQDVLDEMPASPGTVRS